MLSWLVQGFERMVPQPEMPKKPEVSTARQGQPQGLGPAVVALQLPPPEVVGESFPQPFPSHYKGDSGARETSEPLACRAFVTLPKHYFFFLRFLKGFLWKSWFITGAQCLL